MDQQFFVNNRQRVYELVGASFVLISENSSAQEHNDASISSIQRSNLWYLSGITNTEWELVLDGKKQTSYLIAPDISEIHRIFEGSISFDDAKRISGVDEVLDSKAGKRLKEQLFVANSYSQDIAKLRAIKQPEEIAALQRAARLTMESLRLVSEKLSMYKFEYQVEADITHHFRWHNATHAFEPIVASSKNACTLHYAANNSVVVANDLLLIDIGARADGYVADITRTLFLGEPTKRQAAIREAVVIAENQIISLLKPGVKIKDYIENADAVMKEALLSLGLMKDRHDIKSFRRYFPHAISHGLGLDVHESLGGYKEFMPGMVLTVEPGIYVPEEGIGVRIEDDILITDTGYENLTAALSTDL